MLSLGTNCCRAFPCAKCPLQPAVLKPVQTLSPEYPSSPGITFSRQNLTTFLAVVREKSPKLPEVSREDSRCPGNKRPALRGERGCGHRIKMEFPLALWSPGAWGTS